MFSSSQVWGTFVWKPQETKTPWGKFEETLGRQSKGLFYRNPHDKLGPCRSYGVGGGYLSSSGLGSAVMKRKSLAKSSHSPRRLPTAISQPRDRAEKERRPPGPGADPQFATPQGGLEASPRLSSPGRNQAVLLRVESLPAVLAPPLLVLWVGLISFLPQRCLLKLKFRALLWLYRAPYW